MKILSKMKNKDIRMYVSRWIKKNTKHDFTNAYKMAKIFLNQEEWNYSDKNCEAGFAYDWGGLNLNFEEELVFKGIHMKGNALAVVEIPFELYEVRKQYQLNKRTSLNCMI